MTDPGPVSVCMATFNGERHVRQQVESILAELAPDDELVIVDDASTDSTLQVVRGLGDPRIRVLENPTNLGYAATFERALTAAVGRDLFLADQDDVWPAGRVAVMRAALRSGSVVAGNVAVLDGPDRLRGPFGNPDWRLRAADSDRRLGNLLRLAASNMPYYGSAMAVRRDALDLALPFPPSAKELHDAWLALIGIATGSLVHVEQRVVLRRVHEANVTGRVRSPGKVLRGRLLFLRMVLEAWRRARSRGVSRPDRA